MDLFLFSMKYEKILLFAQLWVIYALPIIFFLYMLKRSREAKIRWNLYDYSLLFVPFLIWISLAVLLENIKSVSNFIELPLIGMGTGVLLVFSANSSSNKRVKLGIIVLVIACAIAGLVNLFFPALPE